MRSIYQKTRWKEESTLRWDIAAFNIDSSLHRHYNNIAKPTVKRRSVTELKSFPRKILSVQIQFATTWNWGDSDLQSPTEPKVPGAESGMPFLNKMLSKHSANFQAYRSPISHENQDPKIEKWRYHARSLKCTLQNQPQRPRTAVHTRVRIGIYLGKPSKIQVDQLTENIGKLDLFNW